MSPRVWIKWTALYIYLSQLFTNRYQINVKNILYWHWGWNLSVDYCYTKVDIKLRFNLFCRQWLCYMLFLWSQTLGFHQKWKCMDSPCKNFSPMHFCKAPERTRFCGYRAGKLWIVHSTNQRVQDKRKLY